MDRVDIFSPASVEVTITNNRVTVEVDRKPVLRVVRIGKLEIDDQRARSEASQRHYFAVVKAGFDNLPEEWSGILKSAEHLRKFALIRAGYADVRTISLPTEDAANHVAAVVRSVDPFSVVTVEGTSVHAASAKSQSASAMDRREFHDSKSAVLEVIAEMIGVTADQLSANAGSSA